MLSVERKESSDGVTVFKAADRDAVSAFVRSWAKRQRANHEDLVRVGLFGSYARDDYAPGSDIDLLLIVRDSREPRWFLRSTEYDTLDLPVGADVFVYTEEEARRMAEDNPWFRHVLSETIWLD